MKDSVHFEFVDSGQFSRLPCDVRGGSTGKGYLLCEVTTGEYKGLRACESCLKDGDLDTRLARHIKRLEQYAEYLESLRGRLRAPSYEQYLTADRAADDARLKSHYGVDTVEEARELEERTRLR